MKKVLFRIIIPMLILAVWMIMCYPVCAKADGFDYFLYWIMVGCPYGIRKMSMFLVPKNLGIAGSIGILALDCQREIYDELFEVICEVVCVKRQTIRVAGEEYPYELVKARFLKLNSSHLEYVIGCMKETTTKITNIKAYMVTALYNAPTTINHFYQQEVQHDMYGGGWHEKGIV